MKNPSDKKKSSSENITKYRKKSVCVEKTGRAKKNIGGVNVVNAAFVKELNNVV